MPTSARALPSINTSGLRNASASSSRSARDQPPLTAVYAAASAAYYDRPRSPYPSVDSYETPTHQDNPYSTRLQESGYDSLSRAEGRASYEDRQLYTLGESDLPYDQPDDQPVASGSNSRAMPTPATALVYDPDYVIAMHDFAPETPTATCLSFRAGEVIHVLNRDATGWWDGELDGRRGWFPSNYVSTDAAAFAAAAELAGFTVAHVESTSEWTSKGRHLTVTPQNPGESSRAPSKVSDLSLDSTCTNCKWTPIVTDAEKPLSTKRNAPTETICWVRLVRNERVHPVSRIFYLNLVGMLILSTQGSPRFVSSTYGSDGPRPGVTANSRSRKSSHPFPAIHRLHHLLRPICPFHLRLS